MKTMRRYLFLQDTSSWFFPTLARALIARGHEVRRVNFNGGDVLFWPLPGAVSYRGPLQDWPAYLEDRIVEWRITDVILFGDCRPVHSAATAVAARCGVPVHVFEEGYLRPNWITLERGGANGFSTLPRDPDWFLEAARSTPCWTGGEPVRGSFLRRAVEDLLYNVTMAATAWRFPDYRIHRPWHPFVEYAGWVGRFVRNRLERRRMAARLQALQEGDAPYYLFPLQLDCDSQIQVHSPFGGVAPAMERVIASFAAHAPAGSLLAIKEHPLDNGLTDWRALASEAARRAGVEERIVYLNGGLLEPLIGRAVSVVTVNSTLGMLALAFGRPVATLGTAIYNIPGLTFQGGLDAFWSAGAVPDPTLFDAFRRVVAARTQVNGGFFSTPGLALAVAGTVERLEALAASGAIAPAPEDSSPSRPAVAQLSLQASGA